jgi:hypothetical protein
MSEELKRLLQEASDFAEPIAPEVAIVLQTLLGAVSQGPEALHGLAGLAAGFSRQMLAELQR